MIKETETTEFRSFGKIARLSRDIIITEKIDGTNAQVFITEDGQIFAGSRTKWITPGKQTDNFGFAGWVEQNKEDLLKMGPGRHYGEWYGLGIQRNYDLYERRFTLFGRIVAKEIPKCVSGVVPILYEGPFSSIDISAKLFILERDGSKVVPGFMKPEGIVIFHTASRHLYKKTIEGDDKPKGAK